MRFYTLRNARLDSQVIETQTRKQSSSFKPLPAPPALPTTAKFMRILKNSSTFVMLHSRPSFGFLPVSIVVHIGAEAAVAAAHDEHSRISRDRLVKVLRHVGVTRQPLWAGEGIAHNGTEATNAGVNRCSDFSREATPQHASHSMLFTQLEHRGSRGQTPNYHHVHLCSQLIS